MKGLLQMSVLIGLILIPILMYRRSVAAIFWSTIVLCVAYYGLALFILPRLPG